MATTPSPNDLTRQQLDELDALLQRMLSLPLNKPEPTSTPPFTPPPLPDIPPPRPAASWRTDPPAAPARGPYLHPTTLATHDPLPQAAFTPAASAASTPNFEARVATPPAYPAAPAFPAAPALPTASSLPVLPDLGQDPVQTLGTLRGVDAPATPAGFKSAFAPPPLAPETPLTHPPARPEAMAPSEAHAPAARTPILLWPLRAFNSLIEGALGWLGPMGEILTHPAAKTVLGWSGILLIAASAYWAARHSGLPYPWPH